LRGIARFNKLALKVWGCEQPPAVTSSTHAQFNLTPPERLPDSDAIDDGSGDRLHIYPVDHATEVALKPESERDDHWVAVSLFAGNRTAMSDELRRYVDAWLKDTGRLP
jgi:hypothetical protein